MWHSLNFNKDRFLFAGELHLMHKISVGKREKGTAGGQVGAVRRQRTGNSLEKI